MHSLNNILNVNLHTTVNFTIKNQVFDIQFRVHKPIISDYW